MQIGTKAETVRLVWSRLASSRPMPFVTLYAARVYRRADNTETVVASNDRYKINSSRFSVDARDAFCRAPRFSENTTYIFLRNSRSSASPSVHSRYRKIPDISHGRNERTRRNVQTPPPLLPSGIHRYVLQRLKHERDDFRSRVSRTFGLRDAANRD